MSCIKQILDIKGDKPFVLVPDIGAIEGGGEYNGYEWLITLNRLGHRCGYVALHGDEKLNLEHGYPDLECHGGITFYEDYKFMKSYFNITCPDVWVGFDAGHHYDGKDFEALRRYGMQKDYLDELEKLLLFRCEVRTYDYMREECLSIINQLTGDKNV